MRLVPYRVEQVFLLAHERLCVWIPLPNPGFTLSLA